MVDRKKPMYKGSSHALAEGVETAKSNRCQVFDIKPNCKAYTLAASLKKLAHCLIIEPLKAGKPAVVTESASVISD